MNESEITNRLKEAMGVVHKGEPPSFDEAWTAAESRHRRERRRYATFGGIAAALAIGVIGLMWSKDTGVNDEYLIADSLLNQTRWSAPSDVLLPQHQYDIYREVPFLVEPTNFDEGSLL